MSGPPHQPKEYIITEGELVDLYAMTHGAYEQQATEIHQRVRSRPPSAPMAPEHRTYESCHKHFSCPDGEECWYWSADYYWDCGDGAARVFEASQKAARQARTELLDEFQKFSDEQTQTKGFHSGWLLGVALDHKIESLRQEPDAP